MSLIQRERGGLTVLERSMDAQAIQRALKALDDALILLPPDDYRGPYWKVYQHVSDWQDAVCVYTHMDEAGNPLPLSSGLVNEVDRLRKDGRNKGLDADQHNAQRELQIEAEKAERGQAVVEEHRAKVERGRSSVSFGPLTRLSETPRPIKRKTQ